MVVVSALLEVEGALLSVSLIIDRALISMVAQVLSGKGNGVLAVVLLLEAQLTAGGVVGSVELE